MLVYAGIDEAGYGPMFGPLCVAGTTFILEDHDPAVGAPNLWRLLNRAVCRSPRDKRNRIAIDDSKKLKGANDSARHPLRHLERGVMAFSQAAEQHAQTDDEVYQQFGITTPEAQWYAGSSAVPVAHDPAPLRIAAARLRRAMESANVVCSSLRCIVIDAGEFNEQIDIMGTKAGVNLRHVMCLIDGVWRTHGEHHPRIIVDRQGGRTHYLRDLQLTFPEAEIRITAETDECSRYRLHGEAGDLTLSFMTEAERKHLPVALASMIAKYVRELLMARLNRFFCSHLPELKPTAGYVQDGRRYLAEITPVIEELGLARSSLIRKA